MKVIYIHIYIFIFIYIYIYIYVYYPIIYHIISYYIILCYIIISWLKPSNATSLMLAAAFYPIAKGTRAARGAPAPQCIPLPCTSIAQLQSDDIVDLAGQRKQNLMKKPKKEIKQKFNAILGGLKDRQQIKMLSEYLDGFFDQQPDQQSLGCKRQRQAPPRASSSPSGGRSAPRARIVDAQRGQQRALPAQIPILGQVAMPVTSDQLSKAPPGTRFTCGDFPKTNMCLLEHAPGSRVRQFQWMKKAGGNLVQDKNFDLQEINIDEVHLDKFLGGLRVFGS